jgi:hypothetical protein
MPGEGIVSARRWVALMTVLVAIAAVPGAASASSGTTSPLVLSGPDLTTLGLHPTRASGADGVRTLTAKLPTRFRRTIEHGQTAASAGSRRKLKLSFYAFVLGSNGTASHVLAAWRTTHHAARVSEGAVFATGSRHHATAQLLERDGARLGLIVASVSGSKSTAEQTVKSYGTLAGAHLTAKLPTAAWGKVLEQVNPNGTVSKTTALEAFALAYGPLPGIHPPRGGRETVPSGTLAGAWVLRYLPKLSRRLRKAIDRDLGFASATASPDSAHAADYGDPGFHPIPSLTAAANTWASIYADGGHLGHALTLKIVAGTTTTSMPTTGGTEADADAYPVNAAGAESDSGPYCRIRVSLGTFHGPISYLTTTLAHEVFHCFEFMLDPHWASQGDWLIEGLAEWAALTVDPVATPQAEGWLFAYIGSPGTTLFGRTYDAAGFWGHAMDSNGLLWSEIDSILNAGDDPARFVDAGGEAENFLSTWGSSFFRIAAGGPPWEMQSPEPPLAAYGEPPITDFNPAAGQVVEAAPYTAAVYGVESDAGTPVVHVSINGYARLDRYYNYTDLSDAWFCTTGACVCPPNTIGEVPPTRPLHPLAPLGLGAGQSGTRGTVSAFPLSYFCKPKPQQQGNGDAASGGDPHLIDFDGALFNFQAAGEFTLLKSTTDNLQMQERQQPFPHSRSVSVNTAVAMRDGHAIVEIDSSGDSGVTALVDHRRVRVSMSRLAGGGSLKLSHFGLTLPPGQTPATLCGAGGAPASYRAECEKVIDALVQGSTIATVRWRDGTNVQVANGVTSPNARRWAPALSLHIHVARRRLGHLTGLLGNADVPAADEFRGRNGAHYNQDDILEGDIGTPQQAHVLYDEFGSSWRITQRESLFTYKRKRSTRSYTIKRFPKQAFDLSKQPTGKVAQAGAVCAAAGITNQAAEQACEYDVLATGNPGFVAGALPLQTVASEYNPPAKTPPLHPIDLGLGDSQPRIAFDPSHDDTYVVWVDNSRSSIDVCTVTAAAPDCNGGAGPYKLVDQLALEDGASPAYFSPQVVVQPGGDVVVLAEADGVASATEPAGYSGIGAVAWSSAAGGSAFASGDQGIEDGGTLLASTAGSGDAPGEGAIALNASDIGVYGNSYPFGSGFTDFAPGTSAPSATPVPDSTGDYGDQLEITGNQVASIPDPAVPGEYIVVAVGADYGSPSGCPSGTTEATGYGVAIGTPAELQTQSAWGGSYFKPVSCLAFAPVLAGGGPAGGAIGMLDDEGAGLTGSGSDGIYYRQFDTTTSSFGPPVPVSDETSQTLDGADDLSLSQDSAGGVYAAWFDGRGWTLDYSTTPGSSWPTARATGLVQGASSDAVVDGIGDGAAWLAYNYDAGSGTQEYVVPVSFSQLAQ